MKNYRTALNISLIVIAFLLLTNPSEKSFDSYAKAHISYRLLTTRHRNFMVASVYMAKNVNGEWYYFGIAGNFFEISR